MRTRLRALAPALLGALAAALPALAQGAYAPGGYRIADPRIRTVFYDPDRVVRVDAYTGYQLMIQFAADERIENVAIGDGAAWQVTPNKAADLLFVKPAEQAQRTNMTVVTDHRSYLFELDGHPFGAARPESVTYVLRFTYPPPPAVATVVPPPPPAPPERRNTAYTYTGSRDLLPSVVFDDGRFTYFHWADDTITPAVFVIGADGTESLVNYSWRQGYQAVEQVAASFRLRDGKSVTTVINEAWRPTLRGADAPQPHDARTAREAVRRSGARGGPP